MSSTNKVLFDLVNNLKEVAFLDDEDTNKGDRTTSAGLSVYTPLLSATPTHVPIVGTSTAVRTQFVLYDNPDIGTTKLHFWHGPDVMPPHDHPWQESVDDPNITDLVSIAFSATILRGGYLEERFTLQPCGRYVRTEHRYNRGETNIMPHGVFHRVLAVDSGTVTLMITKPRTTDGKWYFYDPITNIKRDPDKDPNFITALKAINPHLNMPR